MEVRSEAYRHSCRQLPLGWDDLDFDLEPERKDAGSCAFGNAQVDQTAASNTGLPFSITIGNADIAQSSKLSLIVTKVAQDKSTTVSSPFVYTVSADPTVSLDATSTCAAGGKITGVITGTGLTGVTILSVSGTDPSGNLLPDADFTRGYSGKRYRVRVRHQDRHKCGYGQKHPALHLSTKHLDGSPVTISFTVPTAPQKPPR